MAAFNKSVTAMNFYIMECRFWA